MSSKIYALARLMRWHKPVGTVLLILPTLAALVLVSEGPIPAWELLVIFCLGSFLMRSAGCVINDIFDREIDREVARTKTRPLAQGDLTVATAWILFLFLCVSCLVLVLFLNTLTQLMAVGGLLIAALYPLAKRVTFFPQAILGVAFSWGILMASTAVTENVTLSAWLLFAASFFWVIAYDTIYAMMDQVDDSRIGVKSAARFVGDHVRLFLSILYLISFILLLLLGYQQRMGWLYFAATAVVLVFFVVQVIRVGDRSTDNLQSTFNSNQWAWLAVLIGIVLSA